ncbi:MAG: hypothetical protein KIG86_00895 [Eubacteriales bacterium]|nr:hypothetical protein [Eubacteriales bacterium]
MRYLKVFTDFAEVIEPLSDAERGRLFMSMLQYASTGEAGTLSGAERFVWPIAKQNIDRTRVEAGRNAACGSKGGRPKKPAETDLNRKKPAETDLNRKKADKDKDKDKDNIIPPISPNGDIAPLEGGSPRKHKYGEYKNVLLTDDELEKLKAEYADYLDRIERLSSYIASTGKAYKSHYATIRNWARADAEKGRSNGAKQTSSPQRNAEETPRYGTWL